MDSRRQIAKIMRTREGNASGDHRSFYGFFRGLLSQMPDLADMFLGKSHKGLCCGNIASREAQPYRG